MSYSIQPEQSGTCGGSGDYQDTDAPPIDTCGTPQDLERIFVGSKTVINRWTPNTRINWVEDVFWMGTDTLKARAISALLWAFKEWETRVGVLGFHKNPVGAAGGTIEYCLSYSEEVHPTNPKAVCAADLPGTRGLSIIWCYPLANDSTDDGLRQIMLHEVGHVHGLQHEMDEAVATLIGVKNVLSVMNYGMRYDLQQSDVEAVRAFYALPAGPFGQAVIVDHVPK